MFNADTRLRELSTKAMEGTLSEEEFAEMAEMSRAKRKAREDRTALIAGVRETLRSQGVAIHDLFSAAEIAAAVRVSQGRAPNASKALGGVGPAGNTSKGAKKGGSLFAQGECRALMQQALHEAPAGLTPTELVQAVAAKKSLPATDEDSVRLAVYYILRRKNNTDFAVVDPQAKRARWTLGAKA